MLFLSGTSTTNLFDFHLSTFLFWPDKFNCPSLPEFILLVFVFLLLRVFIHFPVMIFTHLPTAALSLCSFSRFSSSLFFFILVSHKALMEFTVPKHTVTPVMMTLHTLSLSYNLYVPVTLTPAGVKYHAVGQQIKETRRYGTRWCSNSF